MFGNLRGLEGVVAGGGIEVELLEADVGIAFGLAEGFYFSYVGGGGGIPEDDCAEGSYFERTDAGSFYLHHAVFLFITPVGGLVEDSVHGLPASVMQVGADVVVAVKDIIVGHELRDAEGVGVFLQVKLQAYSLMAVSVMGPHQVVHRIGGETEDAEVGICLSDCVDYDLARIGRIVHYSLE